MDELISAQEAQKIALESSTHDTTENLKKIISVIMDSVEHGEFNCRVTCDTMISEHIMSYLKRKGYKASYCRIYEDRYIRYDYYKIDISW